MAVLLVVTNVSAVYQDHIVQWDLSNEMFTRQNNIVHVREGDNLIFTCSKNPAQSLQLFWTTVVEVYNACEQTDRHQVQKLFECKRGEPNIDFILKVSQFSELAGAPHYLPGRPVLFIAQPPWCSTANMKLATIRETDQSLFTMKNNSLVNTTMSMASQTEDPDSLNSVPDSGKSLVNRNKIQIDEASDWSNYRFLLLPGSLALLTLVGMQIVLCTFWLPKSVKRYFNCCGRRNQPREQPQVEEANESKLPESNGTSKNCAGRLLGRAAGSRCAANMNRCLTPHHNHHHHHHHQPLTPGRDEEQTVSLLSVPQCCFFPTQHMPQLNKVNGYVPKPKCVQTCSTHPTALPGFVDPV
ncbi:unnamed protein product, partial [Echinostoma caproni]|uniref:Ephrin RBD domain-containing protein n=1 Tax=Echinostoma caproni TaxID=27848 RepID=A0A183A9C4_9TREM